MITKLQRSINSVEKESPTSLKLSRANHAQYDQPRRDHAEASLRLRRGGQPSLQNDTYCEGGETSSWATVADYAETIGAAADAGALGAAGIGLVLAPTGAGFAAAELTALGLKGVAFAANATAAVANWQAGNSGRAAGNVVGAVAGFGAGSLATSGLGRYYASGRMFGNLSAGQVRYANYGGGIVGAVAGDAASGAAAAGCNAITGG